MSLELSPFTACYLDMQFQAVESTGGCVGCYFRGSTNPCNIDTPCESHRREDKKEVIWVKLQKEETPSPKGATILEVRESTRELRKKIYKLIQEFEVDTQMVVHGVNLTHTQVIRGVVSTYDVELDVRLN